MSDKVDSHQLLVELKDLAIELGRTPSRDQFSSRIKNGKDLIIKHFGSYTTFVQAAGLEPNLIRKVNNDIFNKDIEKHLQDYVPKEIPPPEKYPRIAIISDIHWPFHCQRVIDKFYRFIEREQPEYIVLNGDAADYYSYAKFPRSHNQFTPREEVALAKKLNDEFWKTCKGLVKNTKRYQNLGNHDIRPIKRILEEFPEAEDFILQAMRQQFSFQGVETIFDPRQELVLGNIIIHHGFKSKLGDHRDHNLQNSISSHTHRPGVVYRTIRGQPLWELNTGYAGDPNAKGLSYTATRTVDWVQSFGSVSEDGPRVILG